MKLVFSKKCRYLVVLWVQTINNVFFPLLWQITFKKLMAGNWKIQYIIICEAYTLQNHFLFYLKFSTEKLQFFTDNFYKWSLWRINIMNCWNSSGIFEEFHRSNCSSHFLCWNDAKIFKWVPKQFTVCHWLVKLTVRTIACVPI